MDVSAGLLWIGGAVLVVIIAAVIVWVAMSGNRGGGNRPD
jgi:hypothetical protein